jgi:hypothetical protein
MRTMLEAALETFGKTSSLAFQKSVNNGRLSKFLLASKQGEERFETHLLTGIQLVADISATSPHHFLVFCHIFASFWRKIKVDIDLESSRVDLA